MHKAFKRILDLPVLNILRGKDHELCGCNSMREAFK